MGGTPGAPPQPGWQGPPPGPGQGKKSGLTVVIILAVVAVIGLVAFLATSGDDDEEGGGGDDVATGNPGEGEGGDSADASSPEAVPEAFIAAFAEGDCETASGLVAQVSQASISGICEGMASEGTSPMSFGSSELVNEGEGEATVSVTYDVETVSGGVSYDPETGESEEMEPETEMETFTDEVTLVQEGEGWKILSWVTEDGSDLISPEDGASEDDVDSDHLEEEEPSYEDSEDDYSYES